MSAFPGFFFLGAGILGLTASLRTASPLDITFVWAVLGSDFGVRSFIVATVVRSGSVMGVEFSLTTLELVMEEFSL